MKNLVMITSHFPFGTGEPFLENEISFLSGNFDKIIIISQDIKSEQTRSTPSNVKIYRYNTSTGLKGFLNLPLLITRNCGVIAKLYREETRFRKSDSFSLSLRQKLFLFRKIIKALQLRDYVIKVTGRIITEEKTVLYSYWLKTGAHAIALLKEPGLVRIARAHGSDLYEGTDRHGYLPLLKYTAESLDALFFVSEYGRKYFENKFGYTTGRLLLSRLGTIRPEAEKSDKNRTSDEFVIVSCSYLIPLKRVDLLIRSLALVSSSRKIRWIHFGDGELKASLTALAEELLGSKKNLQYEFRGYVPNKELLNFYNAAKVSLFINTSLSEGVPVSIMEAQSFGIPVIATDTGGVREIVTTGTGTLMPVNFEPSELAHLIEYYAELQEHAMEQVRYNAWNNWKRNFDASVNYGDFINQLNSIFESVNNSSRDNEN